MYKIIKMIAVIVAVFAIGSLRHAYSADIPSEPTPSAEAENARIDMQIGKIGLIVGFSGGSGTVYLHGRSYPVRVGGVSIGPSLAFSYIDLTGTVFDLRSIEDLYGIYTAGSAGLAVVVGGKVATLSNSRGITMEVRGNTVGVEFSLDLSGISIQPR
jgi:hypothetical protein